MTIHSIISDSAGKLTKHKEGSIKEMLQVSYPLMLSYLSGYLMLFVDRLILARLSTEAMNAGATIGLLCYIFAYGLIGITSIVEVFVGRLNGAHKFSKMGEPVWQAIWLCGFSFIVCGFLALYGSSWLVPKIYQTIASKYYVIAMLTSPFIGLSAAFSAFFIGQGKGYFVTIAVVVSNIVNFLLAIALVFGVWIFPDYGINGAAIASFIAQIIQILILAVIFFTKHNRDTYGTFNWRFNYTVFKEVLNLGLPNSLSHVLEISAWTLVAHMLASVNNDQVTIFSIGQSLFILFAFFSEGLQKGLIAIASNFIGAKRYHLIIKSIRSANYIHLSFCGILFFILLAKSHTIIRIFFSLEEQLSLFLQQASINCLWVLLYFALDGLVWIRCAILTSLGDVKIIMLVNVINIIMFAVLPIYFFIVKTNGSLMITSWQIASIYAVMNLLIFYYRSKFKLARYI